MLWYCLPDNPKKFRLARGDFFYAQHDANEQAFCFQLFAVSLRIQKLEARSKKQEAFRFLVLQLINMKSRKLAAFLIIFIFILNLLAGKFFWYYSVWWFDMPMHFLGGLWLGLVGTVIFSNPRFQSIRHKILLTLLFVFVAGLFWELFEYATDAWTGAHGFIPLDSLSDMFFDMAGGMTAIVFVRQARHDSTG